MSCRALGLHRAIAERLGVSLREVFEGTGIDPDAVRHHERFVPWSSFALTFTRLAELAGGEDRLVDLAVLVHVPTTIPRYGTLFARLVDPHLLLYAAARLGAPSLFPCLRNRYERLDRSRVRMEIEIPPHLEGSRAFLAVCVAATASLPRVLGLPDAEVEAVFEGDRAVRAVLVLPRGASLPGRLRNAFSALSSRKHLVEELVRQNEGLRAQHQALMAARAEAEELRRKAERASKLKSNFVAAVSHELRTPVNVLSISLRLLTSSSLDERQREQLDVALRSARHVSRVIDDLIDLEGIEVGRLELERSPLSPRELVEEVRRMLASASEQTGVRLTTQVDDGVPAFVEGDAARVRQVLLNLVGNALRYTAEGSVCLRLRALEDGTLRFEVEDTGPGLHEHEREQLFHPFVQGRARSTPRGAGLGLAIARRLVERMGGRIGVDSEPERGSTFWFEVPLVPTQMPKSSRPSRATIRRGLKVLLVEDDELTRKVARMLLESLGCEVSCASDGQEAVTVCERQTFELVLMDCQMPVMSGFEATRALRERDGPNRATCIVGLTAGTREADPGLWGAAGMNQLLQKPLDVDALEVVLGSLTDPR